MGLKAKFNLAMVAAFVVGLSLAALLTHRLVKQNARAEVLQNARVMMEAALAIRDYTVKEIQPLLADQMHVRFLPHTVPSWAAQTNFSKLRTEFPDYTYKEAALNPTNPADRATDWEADIIGSFRRSEDLKTLIVERDTPTGPSLALARPFRITDKACLACHTTAAEAPASMI